MGRSRAAVIVAVSLLVLSACSGTPAKRHHHHTGHHVSDATLPVVAPSIGPTTAVPDPPASAFGTPVYFPGVSDDTFYNTVGVSGDILTTANDTTGVDDACTARGSDLAILSLRGPTPTSLTPHTVNCMSGYGARGGGGAALDGCSWKTGGITRVGRAIYLTVARQLHGCSRGRQDNGIQPSYDASIIKSVDGGRTWTNPWGTTSRTGAAPPWDSRLQRYRAMFPGQQFSAPFFIQYGPGNTETADGADKYLYAVSTDGYTYNGSYLRLARVPLDKVQDAKAWQYYHGGDGTKWTSSVTGATHVLQSEHGLSQPAIQYVPQLKRYVMATFFFSHARTDFPRKSETPFTELRFYTAPKPWGPWTLKYEHPGQRSLWCTSSPCPLDVSGQAPQQVGTPSDWLGLYDTALVQKFVFTRPLQEQALLTCGDWKNWARYPGELLNRLHVVPFDLAKVLGG